MSCKSTGDAKKTLTEAERQLRDELERDASITLISGKAIFPVKNPNQQFLEERKASNQVKLSLYKAVLSNESVVKAKKIISTIEGTPIVTYLLVNKGQITFVGDSSRDDYSSEGISSEMCDGLILGSYILVKDRKNTRYEFQPAREKDKNKVTFMLKCEKRQRKTNGVIVF